jgi:hypothetical protein
LPWLLMISPREVGWIAVGVLLFTLLAIWIQSVWG